MTSLIRPLTFALITLAIGLGFAFYLVEYEARLEHEEAATRFNTLSERAINQLKTRIQLYEYGLKGGRGAMLVAEKHGITHQTFKTYVESRNIKREFPGVHGFGFIRIIKPSEEANFLRAARSEGVPDFNIRQLTPHAGDRFVIQYCEPLAQNRQAIGLDVASEKNRLQAAQEAILHNQATLTHPIRLVQAEGKLGGFLLMLPIYRPNMPLDTPEQRQSAAFALVYTPIVIDEVLADFDLYDGQLSLSLTDEEADPAFVHFYNTHGATLPAAEKLVKTVNVFLFGRTWSVEIKAQPALIQQLTNHGDAYLAKVCALITLLLSVVAFLLQMHAQRRQANQLVNAKLAAIVASAEEAIISKDLKGVVSSWNNHAQKIFGYTAEEAIGKKLLDLIVPSELHAEEQDILNKISHGIPVPRLQTTRRTKAGNLIEVSVSVSPIRGENGVVVGAAKTVRDVTAENRRERQHKLALDAAQIGIWIWDLKTNQLHWDERMFDLYAAPKSLKKSGLYYDFWKTHVHPDDVVYAETKLLQHVAGTGIYNPIFRIIRDDGEMRWIKAAAIAEYDHTGKAVQMVGTNMDITEEGRAKMLIMELNANLEKQVEQRTAELRAAVATAERATTAKSEFLANMSHEIRTPMNAVLGLAQLLQRRSLPPESLDLADKIVLAGRSLLTILNDILDYSKIESGQLTLENEPFSMSEVLDNLATMMSASAADKDIELIIKPPSFHLNYLRGDMLRVGQILMNLTGNAIKFTDYGEVMVTVQALAYEETTVKVRFSVLDSGIGIPAEQQTNLFHPFTQADASTSRRFGGTGLGLAICRQLVTLMGGEIGVDSQVGVGSTFWFTLSFERQARTRSAFQTLENLNVLIADDHPDALDAIAVTARELGWQPTPVLGGQAAIEAALAQTAAGKAYDLILLDWKMPDMDGLSVAKKLYEHAPSHGEPIILMTTAHCRTSLLAEPDANLVQAVLNKPITPSSLFDAAAQLRQYTPPAPTSVPVDRLPYLNNVRILVVDDSDLNREVAKHIFTSEGAIITLANDGRAALDWLTEHPTDVDIVLMDIQMPGMNGLEATRAIRAIPRWANLPIVALTAGALQYQQDQAKAAGMNDFIAKPFEIDAAIKIIQRLVRQTTNLVELNTSAPRRPSVNTDADLPGLAIGKALTVWQKPATYQKYLRNFVVEYADCVATWSALPRDECSLQAHKLKGVAATMGLTEVATAAATLETQLNTAEVALDWSPLQTAMQTALTSIAQYLPPAEIAHPPAATKLDLDVLRPLLQQTLRALDGDNPELVEPCLVQLAEHLAAEQLAPLRHAVENFAFRDGEQAVRVLGDALDISLED